MTNRTRVYCITGEASSYEVVQKIKGNSVEHAVMLIHSIIQFLQNVHKSILQVPPSRSCQIVLNIFKTSSVEVFNTKFTTLGTIKELVEYGDTINGDMSSFNPKDVEQLLCMAESQYNICFRRVNGPASIPQASQASLLLVAVAAGTAGDWPHVGQLSLQS